MRKTLIGLSTALLLGMAGNAMADTIHYTEIYNNPTPDTLMAAGTNTAVSSWTFDLTTDPNWSISGQVFGNGTITLTVADDEDNPTEKATFTFEGGTGVLTQQKIDSGAFNGTFIVNSTAFLDGLITATLTATVGDFYFDQAELNVDSTTPVPEPATMLLLGTGLAGLGGMMRKRRAGRTMG